MSEHYLLNCIDCGKNFFTPGKKAFYESHNLILPKRCKACREKRKNIRVASTFKRIDISALPHSSSTLFIIGNGFDLAHGVKSSYTNFRDSLDEHTQWELETYINVPNLWADFENNLAYVSRERLMDCVEDNLDINLEAKNIDDEDFKYSDMMMSVEDGLTFLYDAQGEIPKAFRRWIEELKMPETLPSLKNILSPDCRYFSFNYTDFLESEYGVPEKKILHIHGCRRNKEDELVLGHGQNPKKNYNEWYEKTHDQYDSKPIWGYRTNKGNKRVVRFPKYQSLTQSTYFAGEKAYFKGTGYQLAAEIASQMIEAYYENSRKKSEILIENNKRWFEKLGDVTDIVVMGHSLMPVDHPYYREIIKYVPNANWYVSWYSADSLEKLKLFMKEMKLQSDRVQIFRIE